MSNHVQRRTVDAVCRCAVLVIGILAPAMVVEGMARAFVEQLPFRDPEELLVISGASQPRAVDLSDWFGSSPTVSGISVATFGRATWSRRSESRRVDVIVSDHSLLPVLGLTPASGRALARSDLDDPGAALVSREFAKTFLEEGALGERVVLNGHPYIIVGVAPDGISRLGRFDVIVPRQARRYWGLSLGSGSSFFREVLLARQSAGATIRDVASDIERLQRLQEFPGIHSSVSVRRLEEVLAKPAIPVLQALGLAALVLFFIAGVSLGMLAATQGADRLPEFALRAALGAAPGQLSWEFVRPWVSALAVAGPLAGLAAAPASHAIRMTLPSLGPNPVWSGYALAGVAACLGVLVSIVFLASRLVLRGLRMPGSGFYAQTAGLTGHRLSRLLLAVESAMAVALVCLATVVANALVEQSSLDVGVTPAGRSSFHIDLGEGRQQQEIAAAWSRLSDEIGPSGALVAPPPWTTSGKSWVSASGDPDVGEMASISRVSGGFFGIAGIPFLEGGDPYLADPVSDAVVLSKALARKLKAGLGSVIDHNGRPRTVAGIVGEVADPGEAPGLVSPRLYGSLLDATSPGSALAVLRSSAGDLKDSRRRFEAAVPWASFSAQRPLADQFMARYERQRLWTGVIGGYALVAAILTAFGIHALVRRSVIRRRQEIGIRLALGATQGQIHAGLLAPLLAPAFTGVGMGAWVGLQLSQFAGRMLPWAEPLNPTAYFLGIGMCLAVSVLAVAPSLRAASGVRAGDLLRGVP